MIDTLHLKHAPEVTKKFSEVLPGSVFERPNGGVPLKAYRYLKLKNQRAVNLFDNDLIDIHWHEDVTIIGRLI